MSHCPLSALLAPSVETDSTDCTKKLDIARDIMDVLNGKWKMEVILVLLQHEKRRFKELQKDISGISSKVLSDVLKDLEEHHILLRSTLDAASVTVDYQLTDYGKSLKQTLADFVKLGMEHRKKVMGK